MTHQHATLEDTVYFWFASNDTSGSGGDGATPLYDVRLAGAAASAAPVLSGTPSLLTHANYPAGCHEVAVAATAANGFAADATYGVFCTIAVDAQNPTGFVGSFELGAAAIATAVWNKSLATHQTALTAGRAISLGGVPIAETTATGTPSTTSIQLTAGSATDNFYIDQPLKIVGGAAAGQTRIITSYTGATKTCAFDEAFTVAPSSGDAMVVGIDHVHPVAQIADAVLDEALSGHTTAGTLGKAVADIETDTGTTLDGKIDALNDISVADILTTQMTESYAANGVAPTLAQAQFAIHQMLQQFGISGTSLTVRKLDDTTTAFVVTLDDATSPTDAKRV